MKHFVTVGLFTVMLAGLQAGGVGLNDAGANGTTADPAAIGGVNDVRSGGAAGGTGPQTLKLARVFAANAVFQRDQVCPVFGVEVPGTTITVTFAGQTLNTTADRNGNWRVNLAPLALNATPQTLTVTGSTKIACTNILVGDVWLISGQSNANYPLRSATGGTEAAAGATNTLLRYWRMSESPGAGRSTWTEAEIAKLTPDSYFSGSWEVSRTTTAGSLSAVGYFFARNILTNQNIPLGLIDCSVGGTMALNWMPPAAMNADPRLKAIAGNFLDSDRVASFVKTRALQNLAAWDAAGRPAPMPEHPYKPGACWRHGLANIAPFALRGILWYQGESDADFYDPFNYDLMARWHTDVFTKLVAAWRGAWENATLPVYSVQLPQMNRPSWPWFRESQLQCARMIANTAIAVAFEYGNPTDVHPANKQPVGDRLALIARALSYGQNIEWSGPQMVNASVLDGSMILKFNHTTGGLVSSDGLALKQFIIAGTDRKFHAATATISGDSVIVSAPQVPQPVAVRYCWIQSGAINFYNGARLPASPFRTDRWTTTNRPVRVACIGDSITFGAGISDTNQTYPARLQALLGTEFDVRNFGKSGATVTRDSFSGTARGYLKQVEHTNALAFEPDIVICNLGINDVSTFADAQRQHLVRDYREIIAAYRALATAPRFILWQPLAPLHQGQTYHRQPVVTEVNNLIRQVADVSGIDVMDMNAPLAGHSDWFPDRLHPNAAGAQRMAEVTHGYLRQTVEPPAGSQPATPEGSGKTVLRRRGDEGVHTYRIPGLTTTKAGTLLAVFDLRHKGGGDLPGDIDVGMRRSTDGGQTWSPMAVVMDYDKTVKGSAGNGVGDPCIVADLQTGSVFVAGLWSFGNRGWVGSGPGLEPTETGQFVLARSDDDGKTWSQPINITRQVKNPEWKLCFQGPGRGIQLRDGALVLPAQFKDGSSNAIPHSFFIYSEDHGQTWKPSPPAIPPGQLPWTTESQVAELADGGILISMRNHDGRKQRAWAVFTRNPATGSLDGGSWSPVWYALDDPTCAAALVSLPSKVPCENFVLFANPASKRKRERMTVYLSRDGGKTWPVSKLVDARPSAYSCLTALPDGGIGLLYECGDTHAAAELMFARFTLDWLTDGADTIKPANQ
jgi:sialidase-1